MTHLTRGISLLLATFAVDLPHAAQAQQPPMPVIGFLRSAAAANSTDLVNAFRQGLNEAGFVAGQNVAVEYRWAEGQTVRLPTLAADLVRRQLAVITASGSEALAAAKAATATIPIVFATGDDPVKLGFVTSINRPGGNITGVSFTNTDLVTKRMELVRELMPEVATIAIFKNPNSPSADPQMRELQTAARHEIPAIYEWRELVAAGGLMSYGTSITDAYRQVGIVGRILKGAEPMHLSVMLPPKFELVVNLKTAKSLALTIPQSILLRAGEVIQ